MIVTCPGCTANYRVRDEAVPAGGAKMRCPRCSTVFLALSPHDMSEDPAAGFDGGGNSPDPISGLFEAFDPSSPSQAGQVHATTVPAPKQGRPPAGAGRRHAASTSIEQLVGMMGGSGPAPVATGGSPFQAVPPTGQQGSGRALGPGDLFPPTPKTGPFGVGAGQDPFGPPGGAPQVAITDDADDPFARLDLSDAARARESSAALREGSGALREGSGPLPLARPPGPRGPDLSSFAEDLRQVKRAAAEPAGPRVARSPPLQAAAPPEQAPSGPSLGAYVASWALLVVGVLTFAVGGGFAAWTLELVDLSAPLMPLLEEKLEVRPPRSTLGRDDVDTERLRVLAERAERSGDLAGAATGWRRVLARGEDGQAKTRLQENLDKLRHPGLLE